MKNKRVFTFYSDPGHGWLKTTRKFLEKLGIDKDISPYSYERNGSVYLEEDSDAGVLIDKLKELGVEIKFIEKNTNKSSKIRSYNSFRTPVPPYSGG